jgi:hypothetical protein
MQDEIKVSEGYQPAHQFISFVEGSSSEFPDPSAYPLQVLGADHNLNYIDGGDPTEGFNPWVTDILVYPSSEYWESLLSANRVRPYIDLSISNYNTLRLPSAVHEYNLYVDNATIYEDLTIHGSTNFSGSMQVSGSVNVTSVTSSEITTGDISSSGDIACSSISGEARTTAPVKYITAASHTLTVQETGSIIQCNPAGASTQIVLPVGPSDGVNFTVMLTADGKTVSFSGLQHAKGFQLTSKFSAATIYYASGWYGIGDLV